MKKDEDTSAVDQYGRELVGDWRAGQSSRNMVVVPGWQPPQAIMKVHMPNGPGYGRLVNQNALRLAQDGTSKFLPV